VKLALPATPVPMFPLPGAFLFPSQILPLHVFEPRYRQMIEDSLDTAGRIVLGTLLEGPDGALPAEPPAVLPVAGLGEIVRHEKLPDGRFHVWLLGLQRVRLEEVPSSRLYRQVRCLPFTEVQASADDSKELRPLLEQATNSRVRANLPIPAGTPTGLLADLLMQAIHAPQAVVADLFSETSVAIRARKALQAHVRYPGPRAAEGDATA
jgi:Lon protease-like protein